MTFSFLIVDDETLSRNYIHDLILEFEPGAAITEVSSAEEALPLLERMKPDILFLDINMPGMDGFTLLELTAYRDFELVFITAYSQYAIKAFKEGACDYLLKPVKKTDFKLTLERALKRRQLEKERREYSAGMTAGGYFRHKLVINHQSGIRIINTATILYLKADNSYTTVFTISGEKIVSSKPIHYFEKILDAGAFFRIHKSYIINLCHLKEYVVSDGRAAVMSDGTKLVISRYRLSDFLQRLKPTA